MFETGPGEWDLGWEGHSTASVGKKLLWSQVISPIDRPLSEGEEEVWKQNTDKGT